MLIPSTKPQVPVPFNGSPRPTLGVEVELQIVHPETQNLHPGSAIVMDILGDHPRIKPELTQSTVEIITGVCDTVGEACDDLCESLKTLYAIGDAHGFTLASAGTHPFARWEDQIIFPSPRYEALVERIQWAARRLNIYGVHVHVGVSSGERCIAISNALVSYLPHILALSASSPFVDGEDTGLDSCRVKIFEVMPTAGLPYRLDNYGEFQAYLNALMNAGAIESIREIWWDIRPHPGYGTLEVRIADAAATITDVCAIAALVQCLVVRLDESYHDGSLHRLLNPWIVRENKWRATRYGLDASIIVDNTGTQRALRDDLEALLEELAPIAEELGCSKELANVVTLLHEGNWSKRQRKIYAESGDLKDVVRYLSAALRKDAMA
jgi:carboxylate-amine ligase